MGTLAVSGIKPDRRGLVPTLDENLSAASRGVILAGAGIDREHSRERSMDIRHNTQP